MAFTDDPYRTVVRVPLGDKLGTVMGEIRTWLDAQKIQPATFTSNIDGGDYVLSIGFKSVHDADCFRQQLPTARSR